MVTDNWILDGKTPVRVDLESWARWLQSGKRHVAEDTIGDYLVSTVFLGVDHQYGDGPPLLFETMVFDKANADIWKNRCSTWDEAEEMHQRGCDFVRAELTLKGE